MNKAYVTIAIEDLIGLLSSYAEISNIKALNLLVYAEEDGVDFLTRIAVPIGKLVLDRKNLEE